MLGSLFGSSAKVTYLGEYTAFFNAALAMRNGLYRTPFPFKDEYFTELEHHAVDFARRTAAKHGSSYFCDSTPWNLHVLPRIAELLPDAVFVLTLRHYAGTVQSFRRSFENGFAWAGSDWAARGEFWSFLYGLSRNVPAERTIPFGYDAFCAAPEQGLRRLMARLEQFGVELPDVDPGVLAVSHAPAAENQVRATVGSKLGPGTVLRPIASYDPDEWTPEIAAAVEPQVAEMHGELLRRFPEDYTAAPTALRPGVGVT
jgi:hypothetical protein